VLLPIFIDFILARSLSVAEGSGVRACGEPAEIQDRHVGLAILAAFPAPGLPSCHQRHWGNIPGIKNLSRLNSSLKI